MGKRHACGGSVMFWIMLGLPSCYFDTYCNTYLGIVDDQVHPFMETVFHDDCCLLQQDNMPFHRAKMLCLIDVYVVHIHYVVCSIDTLHIPLAPITSYQNLIQMILCMYFDHLANCALDAIKCFFCLSAQSISGSGSWTGGCLQ